MRSLRPELGVESAGLAPLGQVPAQVHSVMDEVGIKLDGQYSKELDVDRLGEFDVVVNMSGVPWVFGTTRELIEWDVLDPYGYDIGAYRASRDQVRALVESLLAGK